MADQFSNFAMSTIAGSSAGIGTSLSQIDNTIILAGSDGAKFPATGPFRVVLGPNTAAPEIVICTTRSASTLTVTRGQEGTIAAVWPPSTIVQHTISAGNMNNLWNAYGAIADLNGDILVTGSNSLEFTGIGRTDPSNETIPRLVLSDTASTMDIVAGTSGLRIISNNRNYAENAHIDNSGNLTLYGSSALVVGVSADPTSSVTPGSRSSATANTLDLLMGTGGARFIENSSSTYTSKMNLDNSGNLTIMGNLYVDGSYPGSGGSAGTGIDSNLISPFVLDGLVATKNGSTATELNVTAGVYYPQQSGGVLAMRSANAANYTTSVVSTTYYLDGNPDGTMSWGTSHSTQPNYLPICQVTTNASADISTVTDKRQLNITMFSASVGTMLGLPTYNSGQGGIQLNPGAGDDIVQWQRDTVANYAFAVKDVTSGVLDLSVTTAGNTTIYGTLSVNNGALLTNSLATLVWSENSVDAYGTRTASGSAAPTAPTATAVAGTGLGIGVYQYLVTFLSGNGESFPGTSVSVTTTSGNQKVNVDSIPTSSNSAIWGRNLYRTVAGGSTFLYLGQIANNSSTSYADTTPDGSLGAALSAHPSMAGRIIKNSAGTVMSQLYGDGAVYFDSGNIITNGIGTLTIHPVSNYSALVLQATDAAYYGIYGWGDTSYGSGNGSFCYDVGNNGFVWYAGTKAGITFNGEVTTGGAITSGGNITSNGGSVYSTIFAGKSAGPLYITPDWSGAATGIIFQVWNGTAGVTSFSVGGDFGSAPAYVDSLGNMTANSYYVVSGGITGTIDLDTTNHYFNLFAPEPSGTAYGMSLVGWNGSAIFTGFQIGEDGHSRIGIYRNGAQQTNQIFTGGNTPSSPATGDIWIQA